MSVAISVILPTRERAEACRRAVASLLRARTPGCEVIVIDQSRNDSTRLAISDALPMIRYIESATEGVSAARNVGVRAALGDVLLFTDDDCTVELDWISAWSSAFQEDPSVGIAFGEVNARPFDASAGFVATFETSEGSHGVEFFRQGPVVGIAANMALRRTLLDRIGGFDEALGAGARFRSAGELDLAFRALRAGYRIHHVGAARVLHHGYRSGAAASRLVRGYVGGVGAMYAKHIRCGDRLAAELFVAEAWRQASGVARRALKRRRPLGLRSLIAYVAATAASCLYAVDRDRRLYRIAGSGSRMPIPAAARKAPG